MRRLRPIANPITYHDLSFILKRIGTSHRCAREEGSQYLSNVCGDDGNLRKEVQAIVHPAWQESTTGLSQVEPGDRAQFDTEDLQEHGKQVRYENHK